MSSKPKPHVAKFDAHVPPLEEVAAVLQKGLAGNFASVSVKVVDCPDLQQPPFRLAAPGICSKPRLADVGGPPFLLPLAQTKKVFDFDLISEIVELPGAFIIGAGAGPCHVVGVNSEMIANVQTGASEKNGSYTVKLDEMGKHVQEKMTSKDFCLMGNFLCSEGKPGKVLEVKASKRTGEENFVSAMRKTLADQYGDKPVAVGGAFLIEKGKATIHIMPDFSKTPLMSPAEVDNWLKFFDFSAPLVCLGELVSHDPGYDLRVEHFHCYSEHGEGGHYHYDITPDEVSYLGYFNLGSAVYRVDQPPAYP